MMKNSLVQLRRFRKCLTLPVVCAAIAIHPIAALSSAPAKPAATATGWSHYWNNRNSAARAAFRAALKTNPADTSARRGLGWLATQDNAGNDAIAAWLPLFTMAPGQPETAMLWPRFAATCSDHGNQQALQRAARAVLASKTVSAGFRQAARHALADSLFLSGDTAAAASLRAGSGTLRDWRIIGPFANEAKWGLHRPYEPERVIDFGKACNGKEALSIRWMAAPYVSNDGSVQISYALGDGGPATSYAATAVFAPAAMKATLAFECGGASRIFLNGRLIHNDETQRHKLFAGEAPFVLQEELQAGWNQVLVKVADAEGENAGFSLSILDEKNKPLAADARKAASPAGAPSLPVDVSRPLSVSVEAAAVREILGQPLTNSAVERLALLSNSLVARGETEVAVEALRTALTKYPGSAWLHYELGRALLADQPAEARKERAKAAALNANFALPRIEQLDEDVDNERVKPAQRMARARALVRLAPRSAEAHWQLATCYLETENYGAIAQVGQIAFQLAPGEDGVSTLTACYKLNDDSHRQREVIEQALKKWPNSGVLLIDLAEMWKERGNKALALSAYRRALKADHEPVQTLLAISQLQDTPAERPARIATLRALRTQRPQDASLASRLAEQLAAAGQKPAAVNQMKEAVRLDPSSTVRRDRLMVLSGQKRPLDVVPALPGADIIAKGLKMPRPGGAPYTVLLDEGRVAVFPDYTTVERYHYIVRVYDDAGVRAFSEYSFPVSASSEVTLESARRIGPGGKAQVVETASEQGVSFPSLAPGDIIDVVFRVESRNSGALARRFWMDWGISNREANVVNSRFVLITPPEMAYSVREQGKVSPPSERVVSGWRVREWASRNVPPQAEEPMSPSAREWLTALDISSVSSWSEIARWYREVSGPYTVADSKVRAKALELTKNAKNEEDKIRALVKFVSGIRYQSTPFRLSAFVPTEGSKVLSDGYGDCKDKAALLTALLGAVDIRSDLVLLSPRSFGVLPLLPSPRFNHVITRIRKTEGEVWVDTTANNMEFGVLPLVEQGVPALIIDDATQSLTATPVLPAETNAGKETTEATLYSDGRLEGRLRAAGSGNSGWVIRSAMSQLSEAQRIEVLKKAMPSMLPGSRYLTGSVESLNDPEKPLVLNFTFSCDQYSKRAGNFMLAALPWTVDSEEGVPRSEGRRSLDLETTAWFGTTDKTIALKLPEGYVPEDLAPEVKSESRWGAWRFNYELKDGVLHARSWHVFRVLRVPAAEAEECIAWMKGYQDEYKRQIVLKKP